MLVSEQSDLAQRKFVTPDDLAGRPLLLSRRDLVKREIINWFGAYADQLQIVASGNLPYNLAALGRQGLGVFLNLKLNCQYEGMCYIPLSPKLESHTVLAWKKNQALAPVTGAFVNFAKKYINRMDHDMI